MYSGSIKGGCFPDFRKEYYYRKQFTFVGKSNDIVGDNLIIGDNVQMERALLIVKNNLRIGTNCRIKGIVAAGGEITIGVNFSLQRREDVLEPYFAAMYLE